MIFWIPSMVDAAVPMRPSVVRIVRKAEGWQLERDGTPYFIKGAVGNVHLERLAAAGGNSIRAGVRDLDRAHRLGLTVLAGLPFGKQRWGFDYGDRRRVEAQLDEIRGIVQAHKDHPALLMWALGNELEIHATAEQRVPLWKALNEAAELIHRLDPNHPVITPIGCDFIFQTMLPELDRLCPALDAVGLNAYNDMLRLPEEIARQGWKRPYVVTEFGPRGHWQVPKTPWGMPIEDTSAEKAAFYRRAYRHAVASRPLCLGSYTFHWSQHHEKTHTWYGMFLPDGSPTEAVDAMTEMWTGKPPENRCPTIGPGRIRMEPPGQSPSEPGVYRAGATLACEADASDPDGDPISISWDLRRDVADNPNVGGDREEPVEPIPGSIASQSANRATVRLPSEPGAYRLFVYVRDPQGHAATANVPVRVVK